MVFWAKHVKMCMQSGFCDVLLEHYTTNDVVINSNGHCV